MLRCHHILSGTRFPQLAVTRTVHVYCDSTVDDVMYTAGMYGTISYFAFATSGLLYVVEYEREVYAEIALKNSLKYSRECRPFRCETYNEPSPRQIHRMLARQARATWSKKVKDVPKPTGPKFCELCSGANRSESIVNSHYTQNCWFERGSRL